jgi:hypothetical protein
MISSPNGFSWIKHLPLGAYDKAAKLLNNFGILEKAQKSGAVDLSRSIETILKAPFQSTVPTRSQGEWILPVSLQQLTDSAGGTARKRCVCCYCVHLVNCYSSRTHIKTTEKKIKIKDVTEQTTEVRNKYCPEAMPSHATVMRRPLYRTST